MTRLSPEQILTNVQSTLRATAKWGLGVGIPLVPIAGGVAELAHLSEEVAQGVLATVLLGDAALIGAAVGALFLNRSINRWTA